MNSWYATTIVSKKWYATIKNLCYINWAKINNNDGHVPYVNLINAGWECSDRQLLW